MNVDEIFSMERAPVAQWTERPTANRGDAGSNPARGRAPVFDFDISCADYILHVSSRAKLSYSGNPSHTIGRVLHSCDIS